MKHFPAENSSSSRHSSKKSRRSRTAAAPHRQERRKTVGTFPEFDENDTSKNLPKWMRDEITRIKTKKDDPKDEEKEQSTISELQKLVDEDTDGESSEDDWKVEGRKISEDLAKGINKLNLMMQEKNIAQRKVVRKKLIFHVVILKIFDVLKLH